MASKEQVLKLITLLEEAFGKELSDDAVKVYFELLRDIDFDALEAAAKDHMSSSKWFPKIAELRELATNYARPGLPEPIEAWGIVQKEIQRVGYIGKPEFKQPEIAAMVEALGWKYLCHSENMMADRAHFLKGYEQLRQREAHDRVMLPEIRELTKRLEANVEAS